MSANSARAKRSIRRLFRRLFKRIRPDPITISLFAAAIACFGMGGWLLLQRYVSMRDPIVPDTRQTITDVIDHPAEAQVSSKQAQAYVVPADQPRSIAIPSINASGLIQRVGLTKDNALAVPSSIYFAGWYTGDAKPGDPGLSILDGHVSGWYNDGIFKHLGKVKIGDTVSIEYGDKSWRTFSVVSVKQVPESQASDILFQQQSGIASQLNLITCGGKFDNKTDQYADRIIVIAKRLG